MMCRPANFNINNLCGSGIIKDLNNPDYGRHRLAVGKIICSNCDSLMFKEEQVEGSRENPSFTLCCGKKSFRLPPLPPLPPYIRHLLRHRTAEGRGFIAKIRSYNSIFAFTSFNAKVINYELPLNYNLIINF